jgi:NAD(P)H-dependent FMN reductase
MNALKIVGIGGSLASNSASLEALTVALDGARDYGAEIRLLDLRRLDLPMYVPGNPTVPDAARELCEAVQPAHGLMWSSPLYHGTVSGAFKNALDWLQLLSDRNPPYLTDKVVGLISTAGGNARSAGGEHDGVRRPGVARVGRPARAPDPAGLAGVQGRPYCRHTNRGAIEDARA